MEEELEEGAFTHLLQEAQTDDHQAEARFCAIVNDELRREAARCLRRYGNDGLAQATSLVNEVFVRLFRFRKVPDLKNRRYFFSVVSDQMRQILRERRRRTNSQKAGGHLVRKPLELILDQYIANFYDRAGFDYEALDRAVERLEQGAATRRQYEIVKLRFFAGLTVEQTAEVLGISPRTVANEWKLAKAKLYRELQNEECNDAQGDASARR